MGAYGAIMILYQLYTGDVIPPPLTFFRVTDALEDRITDNNDRRITD